MRPDDFALLSESIATGTIVVGLLKPTAKMPEPPTPMGKRVQKRADKVGKRTVAGAAGQAVGQAGAGRLAGRTCKEEVSSLSGVVG